MSILKTLLHLVVSKVNIYTKVSHPGFLPSLCLHEVTETYIERESIF